MDKILKEKSDNYDKEGDAYYWHTDAFYDSKVPKLDRIPTKADHTFAGFYVDESYTTPFDFENNVVKGDTIVYVKFEISEP